MFYCPASKNDVCFKFCLTTEEMFADQRHSKSEEENMKLLRRPDQSRGWNHMLENLVSSHMVSTPMTGINIYWYGKTAATTNLMDLSAVRRQEGSLDWPQIRYGFRVWIWEWFFCPKPRYENVFKWYILPQMTTTVVWAVERTQQLFDWTQTQLWINQSVLAHIWYVDSGPHLNQSPLILAELWHWPKVLTLSKPYGLTLVWVTDCGPVALGKMCECGEQVKLWVRDTKSDVTVLCICTSIRNVRLLH